MPPMKKLGRAECVPQDEGCGPINLRHIFFLVFDGFCVYTNILIDSSQLRLAS